MCFHWLVIYKTLSEEIMTNYQFRYSIVLFFFHSLLSSKRKEKRKPWRNKMVLYCNSIKWGQRKGIEMRLSSLAYVKAEFFFNPFCLDSLYNYLGFSPSLSPLSKGIIKEKDITLLDRSEYKQIERKGITS